MSPKESLSMQTFRVCIKGKPDMSIRAAKFMFGASEMLYFSDDKDVCVFAVSRGELVSIQLMEPEKSK